MERKQEIKDTSVMQLVALIYSAKEAIDKLSEFELREYNVPLVQARTIYALQKEKKPMTLNELSRKLQRKLNSVSTLVQRMEKKGWLKKEKKENERKFTIHLTEEGNLINSQLNVSNVREVLLILTKDERVQLYSILLKLINKSREILWDKWKDDTPFIV